MKYRESQKDKKLRAWFASDMSHALLRKINIVKGSLRGLSALDINFDFPITAIAGRNGAGKSTILALASCAFHSHPSAFKLPRRKSTYYTFSEFFIQHSSEVPPQGLTINYSIAYNKWRPTPGLVPDGIGIATQTRKKAKGGKWNDYAKRVHRTVVFLGIERIVPHSERSQSRSYSRVFKDAPLSGWERKVREAVGFILGRSYDDFRYVEHSKYSLPIVKCGSAIYSGFNMGAGENALFEIFSTIYSAGPGALLVMDEIELGLHSEAQRRFMDRLKDICLEMHTQVICTTHSKDIFDCLPNEARFFVESVNGKTRVTPGISSEFAFSKLSAINGLEIDVLLEDETAKAIVLSSLPASLRARANFIVVGSATALARQISASYVRKDKKPILAIFDGDQRIREKDNLAHAKNMAEKVGDDFEHWFMQRTCYLPGEIWPELWLLQRASTCTDELADVFGTSEDELIDIIEYAKQAGKHNEFHEIGKQLGLEPAQCLQRITSIVCRGASGELSHVSERIEQTIDL